MTLVAIDALRVKGAGFISSNHDEFGLRWNGSFVAALSYLGKSAYSK